MASIHKLHDGRYKVRWHRLDGSQGSRVTPDNATAKQLKRDIENAHALGRDWAPAGPEPEAAATPAAPALGDVAERYLTSKAMEWKRSTLRVRTDQVGIFLRFAQAKQIGTVAQLSRPILTEYFGWLTEGNGRHGHPRERATARRYVACVEQMWAWAHDFAEDEGWTAVPVARAISKRIPGKPTVWRPAPTWGDMQRAIKAAPGWLGSLFVCLYYTGLRVEQALSLRREDLDLDRLVLRIAPELGKTTAEQAGREMPVSAHFGAWVREAPPVDGGWLVPCAWKRRRARPRDAAAAWTRSGVRKEVWGGRPHHAFRAGFMSSLKREGVELEVIEVLVGHAPTPTAKHYFDPEAFPLRDAVGKIPPHGGA